MTVRFLSGDACCTPRKVEQVWYLNPISTGVMNMVMGSGRQREGSGEGGGKAAYADAIHRGAIANEVCAPATLQFHLAPERMAPPIYYLTPPHLRGGIIEGKDTLRKGRGSFVRMWKFFWNDKVN